MKSKSVTIQMKVLENYFSLVLFVMGIRQFSLLSLWMKAIE